MHILELVAATRCPLSLTGRALPLAEPTSASGERVHVLRPVRLAHGRAEVSRAGEWSDTARPRSFAVDAEP